MLIRWLTTILQGIGIGAANVIPGVSGGTMALIFGIYERLIDAAGSAVRAGILLLKLDFRAAAREFQGLPWIFLLPLAAGIALAPLTGAHFIPNLLDAFPEDSRAAFFGLILGSIAIPWMRIKKPAPADWALLLTAAAAAFLLAGIPTAQDVEPSLIHVFVAGAIAMSAMILPGVSGAYLLLVMGLYSPIFKAIDELDIAVVLVFIAGAALGVGVFSIFIGWLFRVAHDHTMAVLVGLMIGSLRALWPWLGSERELLWLVGTAPIGRILALMTAGLLISGGILFWELRQNRSRETRGEGANQRR